MCIRYVPGIGGLTNGPVDVDEKARFVPGVHARDCNLRARRSRSTTSNSDLSARDVELGTTNSRRAVNRNMFHPDQVITIRERLGDGESPLARSYVGPFSISYLFLIWLRQMGEGAN